MAYRYDIFISYVRAPAMGPWIHNHFLPKLKTRLIDYCDPLPEIFCDESMADGVNLTEELKATIRDSALLLSVWSASYFRSRWCMAEWQSFRKRDEMLGMFTAANPSSLIYPILYAGTHTAFHPDAQKPLLKKDFSELNYPEPVFRESVAYLKFDDLVKEVARDLATRLETLPPWDKEFPIVEAQPLPKAHMNRPAV